MNKQLIFIIITRIITISKTLDLVIRLNNKH